MEIIDMTRSLGLKTIEEIIDDGHSVLVLFDSRVSSNSDYVAINGRMDAEGKPHGHMAAFGTSNKIWNELLWNFLANARPLPTVIVIDYGEDLKFFYMGIDHI
jgi:hypothetical protein